MSHYQPNTQDLLQILQQVLKTPDQLQALAPFTQVDADLVTQVIEEAATFVGEVVAPLNRQGDEVGAQWHNGAVTMPPGFKEAYQAFWQAGWPSLSAATEDGGQGLPAVLEMALYEMLSAANHGWTMAPGILHGAYECVKHHASEELKASYLEKLATGEWLATMCLTEPHAGSDLGLARTKAVPQPDGAYLVSGTKIFISSGEHDLTENIVHLVLARLPEAPPGPKGLSLFLIPKFYPDGTRSAVHCERIEEKMGLHGSPTCVMRFDDARGWMVGEPGKGLNAMFLMMNAARLHVALQGVGLLDAAWQKAHAYAHERRQMRAPGSSSHAPDVIVAHPAVKRMLDTQRAWVDGGRLLAYQTAIELDVSKHGSGAAQAHAQRWCALVTPIMKSIFTHQAFHGGSECLQVFGGHGYVREWGVEQILRDARVAMIYEGTNEIQAIDLLIRKVLPDGAQGLNALLDQVQSSLETMPDSAASLERVRKLRSLTQHILKVAQTDLGAPYRVADDYLRAVGLVLLEWAWLRIMAGLDTSTPEFETRWLAPHQALKAWVLPEFDMRCAIVSQCAAAGLTSLQ